MPVRRSLLSFVLAASLLIPNAAAQTAASGEAVQQTSPQDIRDPEAIKILASAIDAAGGLSALSDIHDFTGSGSIIYKWGSGDVQGSVTVRSRTTTQFRLDASLPDGVRSWFVNDQTGSIREADGYTHEIPFHNAINFGSLTFPYPLLISALRDSLSTIKYLGKISNGGSGAYKIRVQPVPLETEPSGMLHKLSTKDFLIDSSTFLVLSTTDMVHPDYDFNQDYPHEIVFSDYRLVNGILVPLRSQEKVGGQHTWTIQLDNIRLNTGLTESDFRL